MSVHYVSLFRNLAFVVSAMLLCQASPCFAQFLQPGRDVASLQEAFDSTIGAYAGAVYNPATGEVSLTIRSDVQEVLVLGLFGAPFLNDNLNTDTPLGIFEQVDEQGIGQLSFSGLPTGIFNIGPVLPANFAIRSASDFSAIYPDAGIRSGGTGRPELFIGFNVVTSIPEPNGIAVLACTGMVAFLKRRRVLK